MQKADLNIKGDPFWLEGHMPPEAKKDVFENKGSSKDFLEVTNMNGFPHIILKSGIAKGVDENENIMTRTMVFSLYIVSAVASNFQNGLFTQTLSMVKVPEAEYFPSEGGEVVRVNETGDGNYPNIHDGEPIPDTEILAIGGGRDEFDVSIETANLLGEHTDANQSHSLEKIVAYTGKSLVEIGEDIKRNIVNLKISI